MLGKMLIVASIMLARCSVINNQVIYNHKYEEFREACIQKFKKMLNSSDDYFNETCVSVEYLINHSPIREITKDGYKFNFTYEKNNNKISKPAIFSRDDMIEILKAIKPYINFSSVSYVGRLKLENLQNHFKSLYEEKFQQEMGNLSITADASQKLFEGISSIVNTINADRKLYFTILGVTTNIDTLLDSPNANEDSVKADIKNMIDEILKTFLNHCYFGKSNTHFSEFLNNLSEKVRNNFTDLYRDVEAGTISTFY